MIRAYPASSPWVFLRCLVTGLESEASSSFGRSSDVGCPNQAPAITTGHGSSRNGYYAPDRSVVQNATPVAPQEPSLLRSGQPVAAEVETLYAGPPRALALGCHRQSIYTVHMRCHALPKAILQQLT